ncbi:DUF2851 family protein [soil metagenome]
MKKLTLNEKFISRIWENEAYYKDLRTTDNKIVEILDKGQPNFDEGPDYQQLTIRIDGKVFFGDMEIHRTFKDWKAHDHYKNNKYNKVILQIVFWDEDEEKIELPKAKRSRIIPTVVLSKFLTQSIHLIWREIIDNPSPKFKLPCRDFIYKASDLLKSDWIKKLGNRRITEKAKRIEKFFSNKNFSLQNKTHWEITLYTFINEALGYSKNKESFLKFSSLIAQHYERLKKQSLTQSELGSMVFGIGGFLKNLKFRDDYILNLKEIWNSKFAEKNYESMDRSEWVFFRLRPANFPPLRLAYSSALLYELLYNDLLQKIFVPIKNNSDFRKPLSEILENIKADDYWEIHYDLGKESASSASVIGASRVSEIITNVILPFVLFYSKSFSMKDGSMKKITDNVNALYETGKNSNTPNKITKVMQQQLEFKINTLCEEQGIIECHNNYCVKGKCVDCEIGDVVFDHIMVKEPLMIIVY